jgi:putative intracellular protease/amidase
MRIVVILDAGDEQPQRDSRSVVRLETFLTAYYTLRDANAELVLASPEGGYPLALSRVDREDSAPVLQRFRLDRVAREEVADTLGTDQVFAADFDAAFCIGATGTPGHDVTAVLIAALLACGKPVVIMADAARVARHEAGQGMLIVTGAGGSPEAAAHALLGAARRDRGS